MIKCISEVQVGKKYILRDLMIREYFAVYKLIDIHSTHNLSYCFNLIFAGHGHWEKTMEIPFYFILF
jgi:hypothetical protein